jgi:hypothetical protein
MPKQNTRISELLDRLKAHFSRFKLDGLQKELTLQIAPLEKLESYHDIPTFDKRCRNPISPMQRAFCAYSGTWNYGGEIWLHRKEMEYWMRKRVVQRFHKSLRDYWEGSAPNRFADDRLSLLGVTEGVPENLTYYVWTGKTREPEIWSYVGMETRKSKNLEAFFQWWLDGVDRHNEIAEATLEPPE